MTICCTTPVPNMTAVERAEELDRIIASFDQRHDECGLECECFDRGYAEGADSMEDEYGARADGFDECYDDLNALVELIKTTDGTSPELVVDAELTLKKFAEVRNPEPVRPSDVKPSDRLPH